jgi:hypothetical protein
MSCLYKRKICAALSRYIATIVKLYKDGGIPPPLYTALLWQRSTSCYTILALYKRKVCAAGPIVLYPNILLKHENIFF